MIVCDKVCLTVVSTSSLLSCDKSQFSLVDEIPGAGRKELPNWVLSWAYLFGQIRGVWRELLYGLAVFSSVYSSK